MVLLSVWMVVKICPMQWKSIPYMVAMMIQDPMMIQNQIPIQNPIVIQHLLAFDVTDSEGGSNSVDGSKSSNRLVKNIMNGRNDDGGRQRRHCPSTAMKCFPWAAKLLILLWLLLDFAVMV